jgi:hypothetical protein
MKRRWILLGLAVHLCGILWSARHQAVERAAEALVATRQELEEVAFSAQPQTFVRMLSTHLLKACRQRHPKDELVQNLTQRAIQQIPRGGVEVIYVDSQEKVLWTNQPTQSQFSLFSRVMGAHLFQALELRVPEDRPRRKRDLPHLVVHWKTATADPGKIAGVMVILNLRYAPPLRLMDLQIRRLRRRGWNVGFWDSVRETGILPSGAGRDHLAKLQKQLEIGSEPSLEFPGKHGPEIFFAMPRQGHLLLLSLIQPPAPTASPALLGLLFLWLPLILRLRLNSDKKPALSSFLFMSFGVATGLPLLFTLFFWSYFEKNRITLVADNHLKEIEQSLIDLDNEFPRLIRERRLQLRQLTDYFQEQVLTTGSPTLALDRITAKELRSVFSNCYVVDSDGNNLRGYATFDLGLRFFLRSPLATRKKILQLAVDRGFQQRLEESRIFLTITQKPTEILRFWEICFSEAGQEKVLNAISAICRLLVRRFDEAKGFTGKPGKKDGANLVMSSMIDDQTGDLLSYALSSMRTMMPFGGGEFDSRIFVDIIKNSEGRGEYCVFTFTDLRLLELSLLGRVFTRRKEWPPNLRLFAEGPFSFVYFPLNLPQRLFERIEQRLVPPRRFISEVTRLGGEKVLLSAFASRRLHHFLLVGVKPWKLVEEELAGLREKMILTGVLMMILLLVICRRLYTGALQPAWALVDGIQAMKQKDFNHRIPLTTGDEWDEIAVTFNSTLAGMEELGLAGLIQSRLLPNAPIVNRTCRFFGQSIMNQEVGGDYFDAHPCEDGSMAFVMGDVTGHGVSAALVVAMAKSAFQMLLQGGIRAPGEFLTRMNLLLNDHLKKQKLMTMLLGFVYPDGRMVFANAGHPPFYVFSPERGLEKISQDGFPLGIRKKAVFDNVEVRLPPCGTVILFTDGIVEAADPSGEFYGDDRMEAAFRRFGRLPPDRFVAAFQKDLRNFTKTRPWDDDVTVALLEFGSPEEPG